MAGTNKASNSIDNIFEGRFSIKLRDKWRSLAQRGTIQIDLIRRFKEGTQYNN